MAPSPGTFSVFSTACFAVSTTDTVPPFSDVQYARPPSGRNAQARGLGPTLNVLTALPDAASIAVTWPSPSEVTYTSDPSGLVVTPSGSSPTGMVARTLSFATSMIVAAPSSSLEANSFAPSLLSAICSGSEPPCSFLTIWCVAMSMMPMPSAVLSAGGSLLSSTPGPPIGDPLSATKSCVPSGPTLIPRGRLPTSIVSTTSLVPPSITVTVPPVSLVT